jgi:hypothetical protein
MGAQPDHRGGREQRVPGGQAGDGGLALDELGAILGSDVGIKHRGSVVEQLLGGTEVFGARHPVLAFSAVAASYRMIGCHYCLMKVPRPGTVCIRPLFTKMSMARRTVPTARPVSVVRSVIEGSWEVISSRSICARSWAASCW